MKTLKQLADAHKKEFHAKRWQALRDERDGKITIREMDHKIHMYRLELETALSDVEAEFADISKM
jgi:hypothetical protein